MDEARTLVLPMTSGHWTEVARIYREGLDTGIASFETTVPSWEDWDRSHLDICRLVALNDGEVSGWAALSKVSSRCVYGGVAEVSLYVGSRFRGQGVGRTLLERLIVESESEGYWTLQSGIFPENQASIALHEKAGFRKIGIRERIGKRNGEWKDNLLMERRSQRVGMD